MIAMVSSCAAPSAVSVGARYHWEVHVPAVSGLTCPLVSSTEHTDADIDMKPIVRPLTEGEGVGVLAGNAVSSSIMVAA